MADWLGRGGKLGLAAILSLAVAAPAVAAEPVVKLKLSDRFPKDHYVARYSSEYWIDQVSKASNGTIQIQRFGSEQLGKSKDALTLLKAGVFDVGEIVPSYMANQLALTTVAELPGEVGTACEGALAYQALAEDGALLDKQELSPAGLKVLYVVGLPPYQIFASKKIDGVDSFKGMKIRSSGGGMDAALRNIGAVPIRMSAAELFESFSRGTVDGTSFPVASIFSYDLAKYAKWGTRGESFGSNINIYAVTRKTWSSFTPEVRKILSEAGLRTTRHACEMIGKEDDAGFDRLAAEGSTLVRFAPAEREKLKAMLAPAAQDWAKDLDGKGRKGSETLAAFRQAVEKARSGVTN